MPPHPIDVMVGQRVRLRRGQLGLSRAALGQKLGVTFQQVQKYESGVNRMSCSRLYETALALEAPVGFFFMDSRTDDIERNDGQGTVLGLRDGVHLMSAFGRIPSGAVRRRLILLMESLAAESKRMSGPGRWPERSGDDD